MSQDTTLGCGLIAIGRQWGTTPEIPTESSALHFLESAYDLGIRLFDTAPSYGLSEERLGLFLSQLTPDERKGVTVATKFGEHWNSESNSAYADHSFDALKRSLEQSMGRLGTISILQLHKTSPELFRDEAVGRAFEYARELGIALLGASVSDTVSAQLATEDERLGAIQLPYNTESQQFQPALQAASATHKFVLTNRPFQMGQVVAAEAGDKIQMAIESFRFILKEAFTGAVLTGTSNVEHLRENILCFKQAQELINGNTASTR